MSDYVQMPLGKHRWRTLPSGEIEVDGKVPTLDPAQAKIFDAKVWRWHELACKHAQRNELPAHWVLGTIHAESHGNPRAESPVGAWGLMQIMPFNWPRGLDKEAMADPDTNIRVGTDMQARSRPILVDLPRIASGYNAGYSTKKGPHPSRQSPWGMRENKGYISHVVAAANFALPKLRELGASAPPSSGASSDIANKLTLALFALKLFNWGGP